MGNLTHEKIQSLAGVLQEARLARREEKKLTEKVEGLTLSDAYAIQSQGIELRKNEGETVIGYKMGLTSKAKMEQMGLHSPVYGVLTDQMRIANRGHLPLESLIHPKAEPELALRVSRPLVGTVTPQEVLQSCDEAYAALEILDSRYVGFKYFSLEDVVADNSSSSHFVLGDAFPLPQSVEEIGRLSLSFYVNETLKESVLASAILSNPLHSIVELSKMLEAQGTSIPAGAIILTGAATAAVALEKGMRIRCAVENDSEAELVTS